MNEDTLLARCPVLADMLRRGRTSTPDGEQLEFHSNIPTVYAEALFGTVRELKPALCLEVGLAFGTSALAILAGLEAAGSGGRLISIDPNQSGKWRNAGRWAVERAGYAKAHTVIEDYDYVALPEILKEHKEAQFAYIDGWHTFDYALVDFWYVDKMLPVGGVVGFNDCGIAGVAKVLRFMRTHRRYDEMNVGLPIDYGKLAWLRHITRRLRGQGKGISNRQYQDRYFRKAEAWEPAWDFFAEF